MIAVLAVNVNSPSKGRSRKQVQELIRSKSDILVLTEVKRSAGADELVSGLRADGFHIIGWSEASFTGFTTIIATKVAFEGMNLSPSRTQQLKLRSLPEITIIAGYGVSSDPFGRNSEQKVHEKRAWIRSFVGDVRLKAHEVDNLLVIGDLNFVDNSALPQYHALYDFERRAYSDLLAIPMHDLLADSVEYSWVSHQGSGFRFDHAFASTALTRRVDASEYDHSWRAGEERLTDHSAVRVKISATYESVSSSDSSFSPQTTLF